MTEYKFNMIVLEAVSVEYTVEADSLAEAEEKALSGETTYEENFLDANEHTVATPEMFADFIEPERE